MRWKTALGVLLLLIPFALIFVGSVLDLGWGRALAVWGAVGVLLVILMVGVCLISQDMEP